MTRDVRRPRRFRAVAGEIAVAALGTSSLHTGCERHWNVGTGKPTSSSVGAGGESATSVASSGATGGDDGGFLNGPCAPEPIPADLPSGWVPFRDYSCKANLFVPENAAAMPPPIVWEPCGVSPGGAECRRMAHDPASASSFGIVARLPGNTRDLAHPLLTFRRLYHTPEQEANALLGYWIEIVAEPDGPVRAALLEYVSGLSSINGNPFQTEPMAVSQSRWITAIRGVSTFPEDEGYDPGYWFGFVIGDYDGARPHAVLKDNIDYVAWINDKWLLAGRFHSYMIPIVDGVPDTSQRVKISEEYPRWNPQLIGDTAFIEHSGPGFENGIFVWKPGVKPGAKEKLLIGFPDDPTREVNQFQTDGTDMVWWMRDGQQYNIMTAPYTSDPSLLEPRRLRSAPWKFAAPLQVACGYMAQQTSIGLLVVRLSDGYWWNIPQSPGALIYSDVLALTCDEVFTVAQYDGKYSGGIARFKWSTMGPGSPPD